MARVNGWGNAATFSLPTTFMAPLCSYKTVADCNREEFINKIKVPLEYKVIKTENTENVQNMQFEYLSTGIDSSLGVNITWCSNVIITLDLKVAINPTHALVLFMVIVLPFALWILPTCGIRVKSSGTVPLLVPMVPSERTMSFLRSLSNPQLRDSNSR